MVILGPISERNISGYTVYTYHTYMYEVRMGCEQYKLYIVSNKLLSVMHVPVAASDAAGD